MMRHLHSRGAMYGWFAVILLGLLATGCKKLYQELAVEKSGRLVVLPPKMTHPLIYPDFSQEELHQVANDYALSLRRDIHAVLAKRLDVVPQEKVDAYLKANNLYAIHLDHEDSMNTARKCDGDIVVESYIRLIPVHKDNIFAKRRGYDLDAEIRLTDVWNSDTLAVFKFACKREQFVPTFTRLVSKMKVHEK